MCVVVRYRGGMGGKGKASVVEVEVEVEEEVEVEVGPVDAFAFRDVSEEVLVAFAGAEAEAGAAGVGGAGVMAAHLGVEGSYLKDERASIEVDYYCDVVRFCLGLALVPMQASVVYGVCREMLEAVKRGGEGAEPARLGEALQGMLVPRCVPGRGADKAGKQLGLGQGQGQGGAEQGGAAAPVLTLAQGKAVADHVVEGLIKHAALYGLVFATGPPENRVAVVRAAETVGWVPALADAESGEEREARLAAEAEARAAAEAEGEAAREAREAAERAAAEEAEREEADRVRRSLMTRMERRVEDMVKGQVEANKAALVAEQRAKEAELELKVAELEKGKRK